MRLVRWTYAVASALTLCAFSPARPVGAQSAGVNECDAAGRTLIVGGRSGGIGRAAAALPRCREEGGRALARAIRAHARSRDVPVLDTITGAAGQLRDATLFEAAFETAGSSSASPEARVFAFRTLLYTLNPLLRFTYAELAGADGQRNCAGHSVAVHEARHWTGVRLPAGYDDRIRKLGERVTRDLSMPVQVRRAAACATLHRAYPWQDQQPADEPALIVRPKAKP